MERGRSDGRWAGRRLPVMCGAGGIGSLCRLGFLPGPMSADRPLSSASSRSEADTKDARSARLYRVLSRVHEVIRCAEAREPMFQDTCRTLVDHAGLKRAWVGLRRSWPARSARF